MDFINNGPGNKKDDENITCWNLQMKGLYANYYPDNNTETDTDSDSSRQSGSANVTNGILYTTVMLQKVVNGGEFYGYDVFSLFSFFNVVH